MSVRIHDVIETNDDKIRVIGTLDSQPFVMNGDGERWKFSVNDKEMTSPASGAQERFTPVLYAFVARIREASKIWRPVGA